MQYLVVWSLAGTKDQVSTISSPTIVILFGQSPWVLLLMNEINWWQPLKIYVSTYILSLDQISRKWEDSLTFMKAGDQLLGSEIANTEFKGGLYGNYTIHFLNFSYTGLCKLSSKEIEITIKYVPRTIALVSFGREAKYQCLQFACKIRWWYNVF